MRWELLTTWLRLALKRMGRKRSTDVEKVAGFRVAHLSLKTLAQLFDEIFVVGVYSFRAATPAPTIIDCGSNIGMSILFFKRLYPGARIVGFEPDRDTFAKLAENARLNTLADVELHNRAVSDREGTITIYTNADADGSLVTSIMEERVSGKSQTVETVRLSTFITGEVDLLKLDIEGAENLVLPELAASGKLRRIREMFIEYHHHHLAADDDGFAMILGILEEHGFGYQIYSNYRVPFARELFQDILVYAYRKEGGAKGERREEEAR
jgi:FkbM family methyltransferase